MKRVIVATILLFFALSATAKTAVEVRKARLWDAPDHTRIIIELSKRPKSFHIFSLTHIKNKPRVVIDIKSAIIGHSFHDVVYKKGIVKRVRSGKRKGGGLRLVIDLSEISKPRAYIRKLTRNKGYRLIVDLQKANPVRLKSRSKSRSKSKSRQTPIVDKSSVVAKLKTKKSKVIAKRKRSTVKSSKVRSEKVQSRKMYSKLKKKRRFKPTPIRDVIVAIDAGHGGDDPGAIGGKHGTREKDVVLNISRYLASMIRAQDGVQAVLIRNGDYFVDLKRRLKIARRVKADILISIHANSAHRSSASGISVYTLSKKGASSEAAKWLANRENRSDFVGGAQLKKSRRDDSLAKVLLDLSQTSTLQASVNIAQFVLAELRKVGNVHRGGLEKAGFVVLKSPDIPSILIETGFISNPREERKLRSKRYQKQVARYIMKGVIRYFVRHAPPNTRFARQQEILVKSNGSGIAKK